ncbi:MAG: hypothetical protein ACRCYS_00415 [Beijerinckiaceae bacterium]
MAVSGSTDFKLTAGDVVEEARRKIGVFADDEPMTAQELQTGLRALNMMLKTWQADGVTGWTDDDGELPLVAGDGEYLFGTGGNFVTVPLEITNMRIVRNGSEIQMTRLSREEYLMLPNKTTQGYPTQFYYKRERSGGKLYVWPLSATAGDVVKFSYRRVIMDLDLAPDDFDLPQEWQEAVVYGLAERLAENYGLSASPQGQIVMAKAAKAYAIVKGFDAAEGGGSIFIHPMGYAHA